MSEASDSSFPSTRSHREPLDHGSSQSIEYDVAGTDARTQRDCAPTRHQKQRTEQSDSTDQSNVASSFQIGQLIGDRYRLVERLGRGGFGEVYRAHDTQLNRQVAVKRSNGLRSFVAGQIRSEAQAIASLNHPNIISIYDLIVVSDVELLIVMECPKGASLAERLAHRPITMQECVDIALQLANALQHAHSRQLVHSDLKPSNILIADDGRVRLLDFGLAVACFPDQDSHKSTGGTPGYMSPEQVRSESHLIDGRADLWALGAVMYQMVTGVRPFSGKTAAAIYDATLHSQPPPIRQLQPSVDDDLQRIIHRCLQPRMSDRYASAGDLIDDLLHWQKQHGNHDAATSALPSRQSSQRSDSTLRLRSRGLQPFTEDDSESYLSLMPGSRDRSGVPESILFWKRWAESDDPDTDAPVGVLYGPSGSGKTSFVRAGLIRQLDHSICCVYVECRSGDLAGRIMRIIQSRLHDQTPGSSLRELLTRIRTSGSSQPRFRKVLIVLDQFETWAQRATRNERYDFADALRQCDGSQIRALVVTRDDFWMGVTDFLRRIELPLQEGRNIASVDRIDRDHARFVLESIGRANGMLPEKPQPLTTQQNQFLWQAVDELASGDAVIAVHLVMFAQMAQLRQWSPRALRSSGGVAGACSLYFQELFGSGGSLKYCSPEYRRIAPAVTTILAALLPDPDCAVTDHCKTESELRIEARRAKCEHVFDDCLRVLCQDLRLITVVDPDFDDRQDKPSQSVPPSELTYRLAHGFLVEPIREWIDRASKRTWRGRKMARLEEFTRLWSRRPSQSMMPGFFEYCALVAAYRLGAGSATERDFLKAATKHHSGRISIAVIGLLAFIGMTAVALHQRQEARAANQKYVASEIHGLLFDQPQFVTRHIDNLSRHRSSAEVAIAPWLTSEVPALRLRATLFERAQSNDSFDAFADLVADVPAELLPPLLNLASRCSDSVTVLRSRLSGETSDQARYRVAIMLMYLGDTDEIETLLQGSDDYFRDGALLTETCTWRDRPDPWVDLLHDNQNPNVRYHAAIILSTYPRAELESVADRIDLESLVTASEAGVVSAGKLVASHLGRDPYALVRRPPPQADWRTGPDNIPMIRVAAGEYPYSVHPNAPDHVRVKQIEQPFWLASIPVSRRLFAEFLNEVTELPDGSAVLQPSYPKNIPNALLNDQRQPALGIDHQTAVAFCNWLSRREGLQPYYQYTEVPPDVGPDPIEQQLNSSIELLRPAPWTINAQADGYRLPTTAELMVALRCGYRRGFPWRHAKTLAEVGGDYAPAEGSEYPRPLYSLMPNRWGLFVNDDQCGHWVFGRVPAGISVNTDGAYLRPTARMRWQFFSILIAQSETP